MKIWTTTFGCKVNQYETELMRGRMMGPQGEAVPDYRQADLCLINTCSVTAFADKEARQMIRRVLRENPRARTIVTGCYATRAPQTIRSISPRIEIYSNQEKDQLPSCIGFEVSDKRIGIQEFSGRTRAYVKVQDGCQAPCRYCIIPTVRPRLWSKPGDDVLAETETLVSRGYQEIVLTGIRLGLYHGASRRDQTINLLGLLERLVKIPFRFRIRLSSLEVTEVSDELIAFIRTNPKMCRHLHIPLQSGDDQVLRSMGRWYDTAFFRSRIQAVRATLPDCGVTSDIMVGYPAETDRRFQNTVEFIDQINFSGLHVFRFSPREGTAASKLKTIHPQTLSKRAKILGRLNPLLRERFYRRFRGTQREVLPEPTGDGWTDNYVRVQIPFDRISKGLQLAGVWSTEFN